MQTMKTYLAKPHTIARRWYRFDATGKTLGRFAVEIARILRGKHKPEYTPHIDTGDYVVVTNVEKLIVTGNKTDDKIYYHHSGFPGGLKEFTFKHLQKRDPARILKIAVKGMLPKNKIARDMIKKLKIYVGPEHPHHAQQPEEKAVS